MKSFKPDGALQRLCAMSEPCLCRVCASSLKRWYKHLIKLVQVQCTGCEK